ncbi:MAG: DUF4272 domain-containing protein [Lachnospiraceae bacterium]|nr:DUF4272 domain-containing protein [Lachnospiraceae bacterium]
MSLFRKKDKKVKETAQMQEACITFYGCGNDISKLPEKAKSIFRERAVDLVQNEGNGFRVQLQDGSSISFYVENDKRELEKQTNGMANYFMQAPLSNEQVKKAALQQILLFNFIVGISFQIDSDKDRAGYIMDRLKELAQQLPAFILFPNMHLYHPDGKLLLSIEGQSEFEEFYPIASAEMFQHPEMETEADKKRKEKSIGVLKEKGIPFIEHMEVSVYEKNCVIPQKEEILHRAVAVFAACVKGEIYTCGEYEDCEGKTKEVLDKLEELYGFSCCLSAEERAYIEDTTPDPVLHNKFGWRYEGCSVLLWALSLLDMKEPTEICDASQIGGIFWQNDFEGLIKQAVLRSREEIMDLQDLVYRYDWACVEARIKGKELPMLNGEIIYEWHYALNWLTTADGITDWDQVSART